MLNMLDTWPPGGTRHSPAPIQPESGLAPSQDSRKPAHGRSHPSSFGVTPTLATSHRCRHCSNIVATATIATTAPAVVKRFSVCFSLRLTMGYSARRLCVVGDGGETIAPRCDQRANAKDRYAWAEALVAVLNRHRRL